MIEEQTKELAQTYNDLPYPSYIFSHCQIDRINALATLNGLTPPD